MEYTPIGAVTAVERPAADRAPAYGLEPLVVDGNDAEAVFEMARRTIARARAGEGPSLVEAMTYRHGGHSRADPGTYRPEEEVKSWLARDPIPAQRARLLRAGVADEELARIEADAKRAVAEAEKAAREAPEPDAAVATTQVWSDGGSSWRS
jgi:pyruvate dehydrogenase E1 component alpha subunit